MSLTVQVDRKGDVSRMALRGRFDFSAHHDFRLGYENALSADSQALDVDLSGVDYLDSSALGMLLVLKDEADAQRRSLALVNCSPAARSVLEIANFDKLIPIR